MLTVRAVFVDNPLAYVSELRCLELLPASAANRDRRGTGRFEPLSIKKGSSLPVHGGGRTEKGRRDRPRVAEHLPFMDGSSIMRLTGHPTVCFLDDHAFQEAARSEPKGSFVIGFVDRESPGKGISDR